MQFAAGVREHGQAVKFFPRIVALSAINAIVGPRLLQ
jgi:hypothetical protein